MAVADKEKYITTKEAAKIFGLNPAYAARLAKKSADAGNKWPIKRGRPWEAPVSAWKEILNPPRRRKKRRSGRGRPPGSTAEPNQPELISCSKAARIIGISGPWALELSKRARKHKLTWPKWSEKEGMWLASLEDWKKVFEDERLRAWRKK